MFFVHILLTIYRISCIASLELSRKNEILHFLLSLQIGVILEVENRFLLSWIKDADLQPSPNLAWTGASSLNQLEILSATSQQFV